MNRYNKSLLLVFLILLLFFSFIPSVKGILPDNISYSFANDNLTNSTNPQYYNEVNVRDSGVYNGTYNATYSFTNEIIGTEGSDIDYIDSANSPTGVLTQIRREFLGHQNIIAFIDVSSVNTLTSRSLFESTKVSGNIEFWIAFSDGNSKFDIRIIKTEEVKIFFGILNGSFYYFDGTIHNITSVESNVWYHIALYFECGGGGWQGLAPDTFFLIINQVSYGAFPFWNTATNLNKIDFNTDATPQIITYFDAVDYSWDSLHFSFRNILQIQDLNELVETNRFTFDLVSENLLYDIGTDDPSGWTDVENGYDHTNIIQDDTDIPSGSRTNNRLIEIEGNGATHELTGIEKTFSISEGIIDVHMNFNMTLMDNGLGNFNITIYSYDGVSKQVEIGLNFPNPTIFGGKLTYLTSDDNYIALNDYTTSKLAYFQDMNYFIYINTFIAFLRVDSTGSLGSESNRYFFPLINTSNEGLGKIEILSEAFDDSGNDNIYIIKSVGVFNNSQTLSEDFGYLGIRIADDTTFWSYQAHNLLRFEGLGTFSIFSASFSDWIFGGNTEIVTSFQTFNDTEHFINLFDIEFVHFPIIGIFDPILIFYIKNQFNVTSFTIDGIKFFDDTPHDFGFISYSSSGVNNNESFFFIDETNVLRYTHTTNQDNVLEYIQAEFTIGGLSTNNTAVQYTTTKNNNAYGFFRVNYIDTSNIFEIPSITKRTTSLLPNDLSIVSYILLITDNNDNTISGITTGSITNLKILFTDEILSTVITISLVAVLIPLIIILIPSLAFTLKIGKFVFVPFFLLMSVVCIISTIIPLWLFFVIIISLSLFMFQKNERDDI